MKSTEWKFAEARQVKYRTVVKRPRGHYGYSAYGRGHHYVRPQPKILTVTKVFNFNQSNIEYKLQDVINAIDDSLELFEDGRDDSKAD